MKKCVATLLLVFILVGLMGSTSGAFSIFKDIKETDWYYENVKVLVGKSIIKGYTDGSFRPLNHINADEFIKTMVVALGYDPGVGKPYWAQPYIDKALALGIVKEGEMSGYIKPITRAEMSRIAVRTVELIEGSKSYKYGDDSNSIIYKSLGDGNQISNGLVKFVCNSYELGLILGYPDGDFKPNNGLTRSETATAIRRVIDVGQRKPFEKNYSAEDLVFLEKYGFTSFTSGGKKVDPATMKGGSLWSGMSFGIYNSKFEIFVYPFQGGADIQYYEAKTLMTTVFNVTEADANTIINFIDIAFTSKTPFTKKYFNTKDGNQFYVESGNEGLAYGGAIISNIVYQN